MDGDYNMMTGFVDHKYVGLLSPRLEKFQRKDSKLYNFRCPICGDSTSNKSKARGYIYDKKGSLYYRCHNCSASMSLGNFIKQMDASLYQQYALEKYKQGQTGHGKVSEKTPENMFDFSAKPKFSKKITQKSKLADLCRIDNLSTEHKAVRYLSQRQIPESKYNRLFYARDFKKWVRTLSDKYENLPSGEERIVIPYWNEEGELFAAQGRSLDPDNSMRYITVRFDEETTKIYGLDTWDKSKETVVVEGPIDSLFLDNALAMGGADISFDMFDKDKTIFVYDNEPRNKEIIQRIEKTIDSGLRVCFFPEMIAQKDINDMVLAGASSTQLMRIITKNSYQGLAAKAKLISWKKV
jgi:transcription elongation factor Elf1